MRGQASLRDETFAGVRWSGGGHLFRQALGLVVSVALVRLLSPEPFGVVGMAAVVTGFTSMVNNLGFGPALVQRESLTEKHVTGVFWTSVGFGLLLTLLVVWAAPWVGRFYGEPAVEPVLRAMSVLFVLQAIGMAPRSLLQRQMDFERLVKVEMWALLLAGGTAVLMAWLGAGVWALVVQLVGKSAFEAALIWTVVRWRPALDFPAEEVKELAGYGLNLTGFSVVNYCARKADDLLIGRVMGSASLGLYERSYRLMLMPINKVIGAISRVMFPALSVVQDDRARMREIWLRVVRVLSVVCFPMMAGLAVLADSFVVGVLGEQWAGATPVVRILCLVGIIQTVSNPTGWIYKATGRTDWMMRWGLASGGVIVAAIAVGVWLGSIETVAWAYLGANVLLLYPVLAIPGRLIDMSFADAMGAVGPGAAATAAMAGGVLLLDRVVAGGWSPLLTLLTLVPAGAVLYVAASVIVNRKGCREVLEAAAETLPAWSAPLRRVRDALS